MTQALIRMYDAVKPQNIPLDPNKLPADADAVAAYDDGDFAGDWIGCVHRFPELAQQQRVVSIASRLTSIARIMDYEPGNPCYGDPDAVAKWVLAMLLHGVYKPGGYADRSDMPALQAAYVRHNVPRDKTCLWLSAPGVDPTPYLNEGFEAVQDHFDTLFDVSVCKPEFFPPLPVPHAKKPSGHAHALVTHDFATGDWDVHHLPGTGRNEPDYWASAEIQVQRGHFRIKRLPANAEPLGQ